MLGVFPLHQIAHVGVNQLNQSINLKLINREIIFEVFQPGWSKKPVPQFYFCDNFDKCTPVLIIFSLLEQEIYDA